MEPVTHYFRKNTSKTRHLDYGVKLRDRMTLTMCGRLLFGHNKATKNKREITCKKCLAYKLEVN